MHSIRAILIDKNEDIWIGTREGQYIGNAYKCKKDENKFIRIPKKILVKFSQLLLIARKIFMLVVELNMVKVIYLNIMIKIIHLNLH